MFASTLVVGSLDQSSTSSTNYYWYRWVEYTRKLRLPAIKEAVKAMRRPDHVDTDLTLSPRVNAVRSSKTVAISDQAVALAQAGVPVIKLAAGEPDFDTPAPIAEVLHSNS